MTTIRQKVDRQIDKMSKLPILPQILVKLNQMAADSDASAEDLGKIILKDQGLTLRILKVVNSAFYRRSGQERVTTVSKAVVIIGFNGIRRLALGMSVYDMLRDAEEVPAMQAFWSHSLAAGITARLLADQAGYCDLEEAFVSGLVHDIGKLVLARCEPELYSRLLTDDLDPNPRRTRERELFGINHTQAGRRLARRWGLPAILEEVIGDHHVYDTKPLGSGPSLLLRLVIAANRFSRLVMGRARQEEIRQAMEALQKVLGLDKLQIDELHQNVVQEYTELAEAFEVENLPPEPGEWKPWQTRPDIDRDELLIRLQGIAAALVHERDHSQLLDQIMDGILATVAIDRLFLLSFDQATGRLTCLARRGEASEAQETALALSLSDPDPAAAAGSASPWLQSVQHVTDASADVPGGPLIGTLMAELETNAFATIPLLCHGEPLGLLWLDNAATNRALSQPQLEAATTFAHSLALVLAGSHQPA